MTSQSTLATAASALAVLIPAAPSAAQAPAVETAAPATEKLPALETLLEGYEKVTPADGGTKSLYTLYAKKDTHDVLAVLPPDYEKHRIMFGYTLAGGFDVSGIQGYDEFFRWQRYGKRIALLTPQLEVRTTGDLESRRSRERLFTDHLRVDMPIVAEGEGGAPVIDLDDLLVTRSEMFFGFSPGGLDLDMVTSRAVKAFPANVSLSFELPWRAPGYEIDGRLMTLSYSISVLPEDPDYVPREADPRVGYFITSYYDLARGPDSTPRTRYIKRWKLEKADPDLALSPPREPIVFYVDHKTPIRYRRWVREGILAWNRAFEGVGLVDAIEVYQQDARTGAHMEKDPEDVQYNFVVWNSNDIAFAIGPCRVDPRTGRILDADVVMNDGWLRYAVDSYRKYLAEVAVEGMSRETLDWLETRPRWDPRVRLGAGPDPRDAPAAATTAARGAAAPVRLDATRPTHQVVAAAHGHCCRYAAGRAIDLSLARLAGLGPDRADGDGLIDDVPEDFVGGLIRDVVMHEIGHVLGLRHNFRASAAWPIDEINSPAWAAENRPIAASVMDYTPLNFNTREDGVQGPYFMTTLGPYDLWAVRYGYADDDELKGILAEATQPELTLLTDEDLYGPDPAANTSDLGRDPLDFVDGEMALVQRLRGRILERALVKGKSFERVRDAYLTLLALHARDLRTAVRHVGGVTVRRDRVGDAERNPTEVVPAAEQRRALDQVIRYAFADEAFGLTPALLDKMSFDKWFDGAYIRQDMPDPQLDVHDLLLALQASTLTGLINPTRLRRIYDNELRLPADEDALTIAELLERVQEAVWGELDQPAGEAAHTTRRPFISSLRRNLQHEHLERTIDLTMPGGLTGAAAGPVAALAARQLRLLREKVNGTSARAAGRLDAYSAAHLEDAARRIDRALDAMYVYE